MHPGHARKMAARMQAQGHENVWYLENRDGGHGAGVEPETVARVEATAFTFLQRMIGREANWWCGNELRKRAPGGWGCSIGAERLPEARQARTGVACQRRTSVRPTKSARRTRR